MHVNDIIPRLGLDVGRVLIASEQPGTEDTSFIGGSMTDALATPAYPGMFEHVPVLVKRFQGEVWLVSKAGRRVQERTIRWLAHHKFYERTGIQPGNIRFCRERPQKADHCRELGITHFIDDREDVLQHLEGVVAHRFLFGPQTRKVVDQRLSRLATWADATAKVMPGVASDNPHRMS